jgi:hypothetical protein
VFNIIARHIALHFVIRGKLSRDAVRLLRRSLAAAVEEPLDVLDGKNVI